MWFYVYWQRRRNLHLFPFLFLPGSSSSMRVSGWGSIPVISSIQIICLSLGKFYRYKRLFNNTIMGMFQELILPLPGMNIGGGKRNVEHCFLNERRRRGRTPIFLAPFDAELNPRCLDVILSPIYFYWQNYGAPWNTNSMKSGPGEERTVNSSGEMMIGGLRMRGDPYRWRKVKLLLLLFNIEIYWQINNKKFAKYCTHFEP